MLPSRRDGRREIADRGGLDRPHPKLGFAPFGAKAGGPVCEHRDFFQVRVRRLPPSERFPGVFAGWMWNTYASCAVFWIGSRRRRRRHCRRKKRQAASPARVRRIHGRSMASLPFTPCGVVGDRIPPSELSSVSKRPRAARRSVFLIDSDASRARHSAFCGFNQSTPKRRRRRSRAILRRARAERTRRSRGRSRPRRA
jgi:hypothetical protein